VIWREFDEATAAHGLATTGGFVSTTGIAGLTLGGGLGWLSSKYGLAVDNLLSVELVTASGEILDVREEGYPDLFWALRGAGANFGVAASLEYRLHPLTQVTGGLVAYPFSAARDVLRFYREFTATVPDDLFVIAGLIFAPDGSGVPLAAIAVCHCGSPEQAEADLEPLLGYGSPAVSQVGPMPYPEVNMEFDAAYPKGALNYWKSSFMRDLDGGAIDAMVDRFASCPSPMTGVFLEHWHGAATRIGATDTAVPHREPGYNLLITSVWTDPAATDTNVAWTRETYAALEPYYVRRRYVNYLDDDDTGRTAGAPAYGPNHERLRHVKRSYDPENLFRRNQNIEPAPA